MKDTKVTKKWSSTVEVEGLKPSRALKFHQAMGESLSHSITEQEIENEILKKTIRELEDALNPKPLFAKPLVMMVLEEFPKETARSSSKVTKDAKLLVGVRRYVAKNIDKKLSIMWESWKIVFEAGAIDGRIHALKEYLQEALLNDEHFYKNAVSTFMVRISIMDDIVRWKQDMPSKSGIKQI
jgi:hypothetical protein